MVDALRCAHRVVRADGCVVDLHPTAARASMEVGACIAGCVDAGDAPFRHAAASAALARAADERLFTIESSCEFMFLTYGDSADELRDYIVENWRNARVDDDTMRRMRVALAADPRAKPRAREQVRATRLRPLRK
jgi:hypothetical protein